MERDYPNSVYRTTKQEVLLVKTFGYMHSDWSLLIKGKLGKKMRQDTLASILKSPSTLSFQKPHQSKKSVNKQRAALTRTPSSLDKKEKHSHNYYHKQQPRAGKILLQQLCHQDGDKKTNLKLSARHGIFLKCSCTHITTQSLGIVPESSEFFNSEVVHL